MSIYTNHNERLEEISFSFTVIDSTTGGDVGVIAPSLEEEDVTKITQDPKILNSMHLEEDVVEDLRRHPILDGKEAIKGDMTQYAQPVYILRRIWCQ